MDALYFLFSIYWSLNPYPYSILISEMLVVFTIDIPALVMLAICLLIIRKIYKQEEVSKFTVIGMLVLVIGWVMIILHLYSLLIMYYGFMFYIGLMVGVIGVITSIIGDIVDWREKCAQLSKLGTLGKILLYTGIVMYYLFVFYNPFLLLSIVILLLLLIGMPLWVIGNSK